MTHPTTIDPAETLIAAAIALLSRLDDITVAEFERGGERREREAMRKALTQLDPQTIARCGIIAARQEAARTD